MAYSWFSVPSMDRLKDERGRILGEVHDDPGPSGRWRAWGYSKGFTGIQSLMRSDDREECRKFIEERLNMFGDHERER